MVTEAAPTGVLRVGINLGNAALARQDGPSEAPVGVSVDLARLLGASLGVPVDLRPLPGAARVVEALRAGSLDVVFLAIDPDRAAHIHYTAPYLALDGCYLVPSDSALVRSDDIDRPGVRVAVAAGSAYDLYLSRALTAAEIVRAPTSAAVVGMLVASGCHAAAGVRQQLVVEARRPCGLRLLPGRFMRIEQAVGTPLGRPQAARHVAHCIRRAAASGFIDRALAAHGIEGVEVIRPGAPDIRVPPSSSRPERASE